MAVDLVALNAELTTDPLVRGYAGMGNAAAADDLNTFYRQGPAAEGALYNYLAKETARDHSSEPVPTHILGRLHRVISAFNRLGDAAIGTEIFVGAETPGPFSNLTAEGLDACHVLLETALSDRLGSLIQDMNEQKFSDMLDFVVGTGVMKPGDATSIKALSDNRQTRAQELGFGTVSAAEVRWARQL